MTEAKQAWDEVTERFGALSRRLKGSYQHNATASSGGPTPGEGKAVEDALRTLSEAVSQVVTTVSSTVRDPNFTEEAKQAGHALSNALSASFEDLGGEIRNRVGPGLKFPRPGSDPRSTTSGWPDDTPEPPARP
jgi:hypothetical protein